jgi:hypothetical protein
MLNKLLKNFRNSSLKNNSLGKILGRSIETRSNLIYMNMNHFSTKSEKAEETQELQQEEQPKIQINCRNIHQLNN